MKGLVKRAVLIIGLVALTMAFAAPSAEAGLRHRHRVTHRVSHRVHHAYYAHHGVHRVHVRRAPVVVVPVVPSVPYYGHHRGPSVYFHGYVW